MDQNDSIPQDVNPQVQNMINKPPVDPTGFDDNTKIFIEEVMKRVFSGEIDVMKPQTLIHQDIYNGKTEDVRGKADLAAVNLCAKLRELKDLMQISGGEQLYIDPTYQAKLLVEDLKYRKDEFEKQYGDLFVI